MLDAGELFMGGAIVSEVGGGVVNEGGVDEVVFVSVETLSSLIAVASACASLFSV